MNTAFVISYFLSGIGTTIFLGGAVWILIRSFREGIHPRARRTLALQLFMWSAFFIVTAFDNPQQGPVIDISLMSVTTLLIGGFSMIVSLIYPLELSRPGWTTVRNVTRLSLPFLLLTGFYFLMLSLLGQPILDLNNMDELSNALGEFNVWFRLVIYLAVCLYLAYLFLCTSISALRLQKESIGDPSPVDRAQSSWLRIYAIGLSCIAVAYFALLLYGNIWTQLIHRTVAVIVFSVIIYMVGFSASQNPKAAAER